MSLPVPGSKRGEETVIGGWCWARVAPGSDPASSGAPRDAVTLGPLRRPWCRLCRAPTEEVVCGARGRPRTKPSVQVPSAPALLGLTVPSPIPRIPGGTSGGGQGVDNSSLPSQPPAPARHSGRSARQQGADAQPQDHIPGQPRGGWGGRRLPAQAHRLIKPCPSSSLC